MKTIQCFSILLVASSALAYSKNNEHVNGFNDGIKYSDSLLDFYNKNGFDSYLKFHHLRQTQQPPHPLGKKRRQDDEDYGDEDEEQEDEYDEDDQRKETNTIEDKEDDDDDDDSTASASLYEYNETVRGVNLGGWTVTEPYITPSLFWAAAGTSNDESTVPIDEYNYCKQLGTTECYNRLKKHWDTFIVESDFAKIKSWGFNTVRFQIGYWAFARLPSDPYCDGQEEYLVKTIQWCRNNGLKLWLDIHGLPGSQNGFDNSGLRDTYEWMTPINYDLSLKVSYYVFAKYGGPEYYDVISGIENVNEPHSGHYKIENIRAFDIETYSQLRSLKSDNHFAIHDAFRGANDWDSFLTGQVRSSSISSFSKNLTSHNSTYANATSAYTGSYYNVILDHHRYEVFSEGSLNLNVDQHLASLRSYAESISTEKHPAVIGEWSAAITDCAFWLNGVGRGARYEGNYEGVSKIGSCRYSNDVTKMNSSDKKDIRKLIEGQIDLFSNHSKGWFFWCYKTETAIEWDLSKLIENDLFPQPISQRKYKSVLSLNFDSDGNVKNGAFRPLSDGDSHD